MLERVRLPLTFAVILVAVIAGLTWWQNRPVPAPLEIPVGTAPAGRPFRQIKVHVTGAVARPGVYTFTEDARVGDAIERAGGPAPNADLSRINLAQRLRDELQIMVPLATPTPLPVVVTGPDGSPVAVARPAPTATSRLASPPLDAPININTATAAELERVPGLGPVYSRRIVEHREKNGPYLSVGDLRQANVIPASTFERAKDWLRAP